jgi:hypothetical protein
MEQGSKKGNKRPSFQMRWRRKIHMHMQSASVKGERGKERRQQHERNEEWNSNESVSETRNGGQFSERPKEERES